MSEKYKIFEGDEVYFVTFTIVEWIKVLENDDVLFRDASGDARQPRR